jgi:hypothetical protein
MDHAARADYENDRSIFIRRDLRMPLQQLWSRLKRYR